MVYIYSGTIFLIIFIIEYHIDSMLAKQCIIQELLAYLINIAILEGLN